MDERKKALAIQYMREIAGDFPVTDKFPMVLPDRDRMEVTLLGTYGAVVKGRGGKFRVDDNTVAKVEKVMKWMYESPKRGLLLCGTLGNGKTTMLRSLVHILGRAASYYEAQTIFNYYKQNQTPLHIPRNTVLLIDDLGAEPPVCNDYGEKNYPLTELLMERYKTNATTVIATNLTMTQIRDTYGERLQDRMFELCAMLRYDAPSYRKL